MAWGPPRAGQSVARGLLLRVAGACCKVSPASRVLTGPVVDGPALKTAAPDEYDDTFPDFGDDWVILAEAPGHGAA